MRQIFPLSARSFALFLALSLTVSASGPAHADLMSKMNPASWFSGNSAEKRTQESASDAQKRANEAQAQADAALKAAQEALARAEQAKKQAEALQVQAQQQPKATAASKPVVKAPEVLLQEEAQQANTQDATNADASEMAATETEKSKWNPLKLFSKPQTNSAEAVEQPTDAAFTEKSTKKVVAEEVPTEVQQEEKAEAPVEETKAPVSTPWNPMTWFSKPAETTSTDANPPAIAAEEQAAPATSGEVDLKTKAAVMETEKGNITFELYPEQAPATVQNFAKLVSDGFYNRFNMKFHRVLPGFVIQTGDPTGTGAGGSKERIPLEAKNRLSHDAKGIVAMARGADPNSATSQFYITLAPQTSLDGKYAIFGRVIAGLDVLEKIEKNDMLYGIRLVDIDSVVRDPAPDKKKFFSSIF